MMKNFTRSAVAAITVCFLLTGNAIAQTPANDAAGEPEAMTKKFLQHLYKKEYGEAKKCATKKSQPILKQLIAVTRQMAEMAKADPSAKFTENDPSTFTNFKTTINGDTAECIFTNTASKEETMALKKVKGVWLVDLAGK